MVPARPNVPAAGTPRSKVKYSALPSSEDGRVDPQEETPPAEGCCPPQRCPGAAGPRWMELQESPAKAPYRALACFTLQFLVGAFLATAGCLLLAGYLSPVGPRRAVAVLIVGILVLLPGLYHLLFACKAHRGCQGYSYRDLPDCGD
ncbi:transmembrane protein 230-like [Pipistrellus kuhlii]|uniref:transmembrane protein 230-like n=1 Tax=Pipistrellus kuhlii TaxID=59472 RepID=UPI00174F5F47|nr:transmembrane protein 230-like [Pipistrellus kuhlii]